LGANTWTGVADLSSCQSSQLIEQIKQGRPDRIVVANERETNPVLRLAVLQVVYELLAKAPTTASVRRAVAQNLATPGGLR
jgi:predicted HAD superfamily phosphohydrolase YqeG